MKKRGRYGDGCVYQNGSDIWYYKFHVNGRPVCRSARTTDKREAERQLRIEVAKREEGRPIVARELRFADAVALVRADRAKNNKELSPIFEKHLLPFFKPRTKVAAITLERIDDYIESRRREGASNGTINRSLTCLNRAFSLALKRGKIFAKPHIEKLKESAARSGFFERAEYDRVIKALPDHLGHVVTFAYVTGWRLGEVLDLQWRNVDFEAGEVRLDAGTTKNGDGRVFPFTKDLRDVLEKRKSARSANARRGGKLSPYVFTRKNGSRIGSKKPAGTPISAKRKATGRRGAFRKSWRKACAAAGVPGRLFHDLRRTAVRNLVRAGVPERVAMTMTGHKTRSIFERYNIVSPGDLRSAAARLDEISSKLATASENEHRAAENT